MKVLFYLADQNPQRDRTRGITEYTRGLISSLQASGEIEIATVVSRSSFRAESVAGETVIPFRTDRIPGRIAADTLHPYWFPRAPLVHYPKGFLPPFPPRGILCGTVHDLILQYYADKYPETRSRLAWAYWLGVLKRSIPQFDAILTVSNFSKRSIEEFCARYHLRCPPIFVTYEGCRWAQQPAIASKSDYVIHLGSQQPHKRTGDMIKFWKQRNLKELRLMVIGSVTPKMTREIANEAKIELRSALASDDLKKLIAGARALLFPSEIEGFGLPAIEAYAVGTPVVFARNTAVHEILGSGISGGFEVGESDSFRSALDSVLNLTSSEIEKIAGRLLGEYSWARCADKTIACYRQISSKGEPEPGLSSTA